MAEKSKILIIGGGTGYLARFMAEASLKSGHPTFSFVRESSFSDPAKIKILEKFKNAGAKFLFGHLDDHESLVKAIKQVDVVISTTGTTQILDQLKIVAAIKEAGNLKRFVPSEFGNDGDHTNAVQPGNVIYEMKDKIRKAIKAEGIPYTFVCSNYSAGHFIPTLGQVGVTAPPRDKVIILGDGNVKAIFNSEHDIGVYTIKAVDDPRTLNKTLHIRPPKNIYSYNEIVALWEKKIGNTLEKIYVPEDQIIKQIQESQEPISTTLALNHSVFINGDQTNFEIKSPHEVEAFELYPDVKYTTVEEYLDQFV